MSAQVNIPADKAAMFTSATDEWPTPQAFFDRLHAEFRFTLDPCCTKATAKAGTFFTVHDNGLSRSWGGHRVFMNPPYGRNIGAWVGKAYSEARRGGAVIVVGLVPSRCDTRWWHEFVMLAQEIRFLRGRLAFGDAESCAPFPSCVVVWSGTEDASPTVSSMRAKPESLTTVQEGLFDGRPLDRLH